MNYGACWAVLLLDRTPVRDLFDWTPTEQDIKFDQTDTYPEMLLTGRAPRAPRTLAAGTWGIGLGIGESSDIPGTPPSGAVLCVRELEVPVSTRHVSIHADFGDPCRIEVELDPAAGPAQDSSTPVRQWSPPAEGDFDQCRYRRLLLRFDGDGTPWYEDVDSGTRVEVGWPEFGGWTIERSGVDAVLVSPDRSVTLPEWSIRGEQCLLEADGHLWIGDTNAPWEPWQMGLGIYEEIIRELGRLARDLPLGPPPTAVMITRLAPETPPRSTLRALDREIRDGANGWSTGHPGYFLGGFWRLIESEGLMFGAELGSGQQWRIYPHAGFAHAFSSPDGWFARRVYEFRTPARNVVSTMADTVTLWENCANVVLPPIFPGPLEPGYETGYDPDGELMTVFVYEEDSDAGTEIIVDMSDEACRAHPVLGPMIEHLLTDDP